jgi:hypothetical protein
VHFNAAYGRDGSRNAGKGYGWADYDSRRCAVRSGRVMNVIGEPVDQMGPIEAKRRDPDSQTGSGVHRTEHPA